MAANQQHHAPGGHYSGKNPIPNIQKFVENLDKDKAERDRQINEQQKAKKAGVQPHQNAQRAPKASQREVTDPTTGNEVRIEDVGEEMMGAVKDPKLSVPNANLGKPTVSTFWDTQDILRS